MIRRTICVLAFSIALMDSATAASSIEAQRDAARNEIDTPEKAEAFFEKNQSIAAPDGFQLTYGSCPEDDPYNACNNGQASSAFELPFAYRGSYQAQRNIAYCLYSGCENAIIPNRMLGCAWRIVILGSGSASVDSSDEMNFDVCEKNLSPTELTASRAQAARLFKIIYKRSLPKGLR